jgi:hypothetical protein
MVVLVTKQTQLLLRKQTGEACVTALACKSLLIPHAGAGCSVRLSSAIIVDACRSLLIARFGCAACG